MHDFTDQVERILMVLVLIPFGGNLAQGMLAPLTWQGALLGLGFLFIIRPVAAILSLTGSEISMKERFFVSFFGIRGIGSFFYLAFALYKVKFTEADQLWAITGFIVLMSIVLHGISASPVLKYIDRKRNTGN
ncbi:MAG: hypothetical protein EOO39_42880 [Cytophagaceae bacterium]|nr:MAG: hypothetical protein EOO39_42880 [Cytophagaceae bacterium]